MKKYEEIAKECEKRNDYEGALRELKEVLNIKKLNYGAQSAVVSIFHLLINFTVYSNMHWNSKDSQFTFNCIDERLEF